MSGEPIAPHSIGTHVISCERCLNWFSYIDLTSRLCRACHNLKFNETLENIDTYEFDRLKYNFAKEQNVNREFTHQEISFANILENAKIGKELIKDLPLIEFADTMSFTIPNGERSNLVYFINEKFKQRVAELRVELPRMPTIWVYELNGFTHMSLEKPTESYAVILHKIENYIPEAVPQDPIPTEKPVKMDEAKMFFERILKAGIEA